MNSVLRALRILAAALAAAMVVLIVLWLRRDANPPLTSPVGAAARIADAADAPLAGAAASAAASPGPTTSTPSPAAKAGDSADQDAVLFGTVCRVDGSAVKQGVLWLQREGKQVGTASLRDGTFAFPGLQAGVHHLTSRIADELALDREVIVRAPHTRLDLTLTPRWVLQVEAVTPDGKPLSTAFGAAVMLSRHLGALAFAAPLSGDLPSSAPQAGIGASRSNDLFAERGQKALPKEVVGVLTLPAGQPVHVALLFGGALLAQQPVTPGQESVRFVVTVEAALGKTGKVRFRCVDADGAPVAGANVWMSGGSGSTMSNKTTAEGHFAAVDQLPGRIGFSIRMKDQQLPPFDVLLAAGADLDLGTLAMQRSVALELSLAELGKGGQVTLCWLDVPTGSGWLPRELFYRADNGTKQTVSLFPGRYAVVARGEAGVRVQTLDTAALPPSPLRFALQPGAPVKIDNRIGAGFARYWIATASGLPVYRGELGSRPGPTFELPPGDYVATIDAGNGAITKKPFTLPAGGTTLVLP